GADQTGQFRQQAFRKRVGVSSTGRSAMDIGIERVLLLLQETFPLVRPTHIAFDILEDGGRDPVDLREIKVPDSGRCTPENFGGKLIHMAETPGSRPTENAIEPRPQRQQHKRERTVTSAVV